MPRILSVIFVIGVCSLAGGWITISAALAGEQRAEKASPELVAPEAVEREFFQPETTKAVALIFILPDCPISNSYAPHYQRLHAQFAPRGIPVVLVHVDPDMTPETAARHAKERDWTMPLVLDPKHVWARRAGASRAPEAAVFSREGKLLYLGRIDDRYISPGKRRTQLTSQDLNDAFEAILAGRPVPKPRTQAVGCPLPPSADAE